MSMDNRVKGDPVRLDLTSLKGSHAGENAGIGSRQPNGRPR